MNFQGYLTFSKWLLYLLHPLYKQYLCWLIAYHVYHSSLTISMFHKLICIAGVVFSAISLPIDKRNEYNFISNKYMQKHQFLDSPNGSICMVLATNSRFMHQQVNHTCKSECHCIKLSIKLVQYLCC